MHCNYLLVRSVPSSIPDLVFRTASEAVAEAAVPWTTKAVAAAVFPNIAPKNLTMEVLKQADLGVPLIFFESGIPLQGDRKGRCQKYLLVSPKLFDPRKYIIHS